mgnify:CR=1 FL=1
MKPIARKYRFEEVPPEKERWQALPLEVRLQAVVEIAFSRARLQGQQNLSRWPAKDPWPSQRKMHLRLQGNPVAVADAVALAQAQP